MFLILIWERVYHIAPFSFAPYQAGKSDRQSPSAAVLFQIIDLLPMIIQGRAGIAAQLFWLLFDVEESEETPTGFIVKIS